ncbi:MAG TPA: hypothetical protein VK831_02380 [Candidatus Deferrimicrobiaceae bacterium]|nr:hypothetical protein [Candidatus Deferrimicrobiaceae bacterium]
MVGRQFLSRAEPGFTLPAFERLAPPPPPDLVAARIETGSAPGEIVADLHGRGGWIARVAVDHQRRGFSLETSPLTRLLAEVVLRPPDLRHLDAAFGSLAASPRGETSLRLAIADTFASRCATCGRPTTLDELAWGPEGPRTKSYRCRVCRDQQGGAEGRVADLDDADRDRAVQDVGAAAARDRLRGRFPVPDGGEALVEALLDLHTDRQLVGLAAILERIEGDLRAAPVESALRLAFLHAVLPASRIGAGAGRVPALRIAGGTVRTPIPESWRERNPWLAFEDGFREVRAFVQRLESRSGGGIEARPGSDLRSLVEGSALAVVRVLTPDALAMFAGEAREAPREPGSRPPAGPRIRLVIGQPPARFSQERLAAAYHGTAWTLGREAASLLPLESLLGPAIRAPWSWQAATMRRSLEAAAPHLARDGRVVLLLEHGGPEALVAGVLAGVGAGYRVVEARLADADDEIGGVVELIPPGGILPPPARTRGNVVLEPAGGRGDPELVPGPGLFAPPERIDARPFSAAEASHTVLETAVDVLRARGEPARYERLLGEVLVGLDRSGQLRRLVASADDVLGGPAGPGEPEAEAVPDRDEAKPSTSSGGEPESPRPRAATRRSSVFRAPPPSRDPVDRVLSLVHDELGRPEQRRVVEIEADRWWLGDRADRQTAAVPLSDRVEWAVYSLLSTAGPMSEAAFFERIATLFSGHDLPDEALVRACLESYRSPRSEPDRLVTGEDVRRRTAAHTELLAHLANAGHRLRLRVWLGRREQSRRIGGRTLVDYLDRREREPWAASFARASAEDVEAVDCIWYLRGGGAFLFEVEWTAMLGDLLLRRHARIPPDEGLVRFLVLAPERRELLRYKLDVSPILRSAFETGNWHVVLWPHLRAWLDREPLDLAGLERYLGLDPLVERSAEQLGLFEPPDAVG